MKAVVASNPRCATHSLWMSVHRGCPVETRGPHNQELDNFLAHLETQRHNSAATSNVRLAALHAFARYVPPHHPEHLELCQRVIAIPFK